MSCPKTPPTDRPRDLGFERRSMVPWFHPRELIDAGFVSGISSLFGTYADKREMEAALQQPEVYGEWANRDDVWLDFTADLGDGWNPTYAVARVLADKTRDLSLLGGGASHPTRRGQLLVLGGDQVYPTAGTKAYQDRFVGPYTAALPCVIDGEPPTLFAVPGNHDWYDGLTSFLRLFCQRRWIGGWRTRQSRSYFAIRLPHNWWLWGIDIQLHADIDQPQLEYFRAVATGALGGQQPQPKFLDGHRIILCTAQPSWVHATPEAPGAYDNLDFFERKIINEHGGSLMLTLTGDLHHYTRYHDDGGTHKITAGGGGAYLYGTHTLPGELALGREAKRFTQTSKPYPDRRTSRRLAWGALRFPFLPLNWQFTAFLGLVYLLVGWALESASQSLDRDFMATVSTLPFTLSGVGEVWQAWLGILLHSPGNSALAAGLVLGMGAFARGGRPLTRWVVGVLHGAIHVALVVGLVWIIAHVSLQRLGLALDSVGQVLGFIAAMVVLGGIAGAMLMAVYLVLSNAFFGLHPNEVFVTQAIQDYKNLIRMHLDTEGALTVYPVAVPRVPRRWRFNPAARNGEPWFEPAEGDLSAHLIEGPIVIRGR